MTHALTEIAALLAAAVVIVPLAQRLGLGAVIGYLIAGVLLGPHGLGLISSSSEHLDQASELGVVFLLFLIGLELDLKRLWNLKWQIFGMGAAQILLLSLLTVGLALLFEVNWRSAIVLGLALSMSSTAIATQILKERNLLATAGGSAAFSILLFQDIAVIPILALLPLLAGMEGSRNAEPGWKILVVVAAVVVIGRVLLRHVFRLVASAHLREVFTALCLLIVVGLAALMQSMGVSMGLGAFLGGVLLASSEYRHAIQTDIEPFKGLLLGLFFMSVGKAVDFTAIAAQPGRILVLLMAVVALKTVAHIAVGWVFRVPNKEVPFFAGVISQVGEFAFVLFAAAAGYGLFSNSEIAVWSAVIALSMGTTPILTSLYDRLIAPRMATSIDLSGETIVNEEPEVLIAGFGRVGQIVARLLYANRIRATVLDHDPEQIEAVRRFGFKVYYGDATRLDLLEAAGARTAKILVVAVDDVEDNLEVVDLAREYFPHLQIVARARNVAHVYKLIERDVKIWERETFDSSLRMGVEVLNLLGWSPYQAVRAGHKFRDFNLHTIHELYTKRSNEREMLSVARQAREDLEKMFAGEGQNFRRVDDGWDIHPEGR
jgi:glutathione-regulated potassium-efflux system ancillary protein KefC